MAWLIMSDRQIQYCDIDSIVKYILLFYVICFFTVSSTFAIFISKMRYISYNRARFLGNTICMYLIFPENTQNHGKRQHCQKYNVHLL